MTEYYGGNSIAVVLTGMGEDGAEGTGSIQKERGKVICQNKPTSLIFGMPWRVIGRGNADFVLPHTKSVKK